MFYDEAAEPLTFSFLLIENLSLMSLSSAIEPLRSANRLIGREAFRWRLCSIDGEPVVASNGIRLDALPVAQALEGAHAIFVCGGMRIAPDDVTRYLAVLRGAARRGIAVGSLSTGSYLLAWAGLLDGYRCTIHWENGAAFEEDFPKVIATGKIYEIDRDRMTCSGGTAAMDMMLHVIADRTDPDLAQRVANQFHHERIRDANDEQRGGRLRRVGSLPAPLQRTVQTMQRHLETPVSVAELAEVAGLSPRQLERLFNQHLGMTPARYYLSLRVDRARELLIYTNQPILEIAVAVGFASTSHLGQWFRRLYGMRPRELRARAGQRQPGPGPAAGGPADFLPPPAGSDVGTLSPAVAFGTDLPREP
ncbi:GlxA family transcriptional regulator [Ancylobacter lacus]|uniref:GlxA family transcriptional regulator n=1 Tax=Ancylobacter lacus TaxID=2579970 RepID=UPI001BD15E20|nr:GlxA family transcriptional regulator [Ancylobacter lacus]MBS7537496.1 GlxA family transcriptional regulator [Ancylobacter lacus]